MHLRIWVSRAEKDLKYDQVHPPHVTDDTQPKRAESCLMKILHPSYFELRAAGTLATEVAIVPGAVYAPEVIVLGLQDF